MKTYEFFVTGQDRKNLVTALSEILDTPKKYLGTPSYGYQVGELIIDRNGAVSGELEAEVLEALVERGFVSMIGTSGEEDAPEAEAQAEPEEAAETDTISITVPLDDFTPESLDNLCKMVTAKEPLIEKALGVEAIPIKLLENGIEFPWFRAEHSDHMMAYAQFITALCTTAKEKKRVTAKPQEHFENERFTLRVWLIGLGLVGAEYSLIRQLLTKPLSGNGAWRYGAPDKEAVTEAASAPEATEVASDEAEIAAGEAPADEALKDTAPEAKAPAVADTAADEGEVEDNA